MAAFNYILQITGDCQSTGIGVINLIPTGGTAPYSYIWSLIGGVGGPMPPSQAASADPINVPNGNYQLQVTDANGCQTTVIT
jgi:hypothetical protein